MPWFVIDAIVYAALIAGAVACARFVRAEVPRQPATRVGGIECWVKATKQSRSRDINASLKVRARPAPEFTVRHECWYDRFAKALGLSVEFQTSDPRFDAAVYIVCDDPAVHRWLELDVASRNDLIELLALEPVDRGRVKAVSCDGETLNVEAHASAAALGKGLNTAAVGQALAEASVVRAQQLAERLMRLAPYTAGDSEVRDRFAPKVRKLILFGFGFFAASMLVWALPSEPLIEFSDDSALLSLSAKSALGVTVAIALVIFTMLRGSSRVHGTLASVLALIVAGMCFGSPRVMSHLNEELDTAAPVEIDATVASRDIVGSKSKTFHLTVDGVPAHAHADLKVRPAIYNLVASGGTLRLQLHRGFFAVPWLSANGA